MCKTCASDGQLINLAAWAAGEGDGRVGRACRGDDKQCYGLASLAGCRV